MESRYWLGWGLERETSSVSRCFWPFIFGVAVATAGPAAFAQDYTAGKTPAQLFASDCSGCHKSPQGLAKGKDTKSLASFLREHYTTKLETAGALASYVAGSGGDAAAPKPQPEREGAAGTKPKKSGSEGDQAEKRGPKSRAVSVPFEEPPGEGGQRRPAPRPRAPIASDGEAKPDGGHKLTPSRAAVRPDGAKPHEPGAPKPRPQDGERAGEHPPSITSTEGGAKPARRPTSSAAPAAAARPPETRTEMPAAKLKGYAASGEGANPPEISATDPAKSLEAYANSGEGAHVPPDASKAGVPTRAEPPAETSVPAASSAAGGSTEGSTPPPDPARGTEKRKSSAASTAPGGSTAVVPSRPRRLAAPPVVPVERTGRD